MSEYLTADVDALWELTEKVGNAMVEGGCDIRKQCTLGSCAARIWKDTFTKDIPKLQKGHAATWSETNRGGFSGPLGQMDCKAKPGEYTYKVDITSLYSSACSNIEYECEVLPIIASKWHILATKARPEPTAMQCFSAIAES